MYISMTGYTDNTSFFFANRHFIRKALSIKGLQKGGMAFFPKSLTPKGL